MTLAHNALGGYRFLVAQGRPFSGGAVADNGYDFAHARFATPVPLSRGLAAASLHVTSTGRPIQAIGGFELRIPSPMSNAGIEAFNREYVASLSAIGLVVEGLMPGARTNVAATVGGVSEPCVFAVSYTVPMGKRSGPAFILSGATEDEEADPATMIDSIMKQLSGRLDEIGATWQDSTAIQLYGVQQVQECVAQTVLKRLGKAAIHGIQWFPSLPPIEGLHLEIDARSAGVELLLPA